MHRTDLLQKLMSYKSRWPMESATVNRFIRFVEVYDTCFERSLEIGHVTGSAWVVDKSGQRVLLTHHRKLNRWLQLGGHADGESNVQAVALREIWEESGLCSARPLGDDIFDIDIHLIPARGNEPAHFHYDVRFAFQVHGDEPFIVSDESHDLDWVSISGLRDYSEEESMLRMARKWLARS